MAITRGQSGAGCSVTADPAPQAAARAATGASRRSSTVAAAAALPSAGEGQPAAAEGVPPAGAASAAAAAAAAGEPATQPQQQPGQQAQPLARSSSRKGPKPAAAPSLDLDLSRLAETRAKALRIAEQLAELYPDPPIPLDHASPFQLLCAVLLSAQTTDKKVNEVTPPLFALAPDAAAMAALEVATIEGCIRQLGLAPTKAKNLKAMSQMLLEQHGGAVPDTFEALEVLPGVGHKTASVVMAQAFGRSAFPVDTHIHRLAQRWGLTAGRSVEQTEADLKLAFPEHLWRDLHLQIIFFGRQECPALRHDPTTCPICSWAAVPPYNKAGASPLKPGQRADGSSPKRAKPSSKTAGAKRPAAAKHTAAAAAAAAPAKRPKAGR